MNIYASVSIGNTDNKLTQQQWHDFVAAVNDVLNRYGKIHFFGGASNWEPWQNVAWIVECAYTADISNFAVALEAIRKRYNQDSIFILEGSAKFQGAVELASPPNGARDASAVLESDDE